ncbi:hypothetical protein B9G39_27015 [Zooshikella ganghwensis]|uniref:Uncharacterized protein n=2 Tax=Zooshikella ganghwensis TaxID=202772 RepID=A0A4P9VFD0_9GAMM|nr:hypothetical protein B9G39_27015 [Zooshikella ganghwensis]
MLTLNMKFNEKITIGRFSAIIYLEENCDRQLNRCFKLLELTGDKKKIHNVKYYQRFHIAGASIYVMKPKKVQYDIRRPRTGQIKLCFDAPESIRIMREKLVAKKHYKAA